MAVKRIMTLLALVFIVLMTASSCTRVLATYNWRFLLEEPQLSDIAKLSPETLSFSDDSIDITFSLGEVTTVFKDDIIGTFTGEDLKEINFHVLNKTDSGIKVNWDDLSMVNPLGISSRLIHGGVRLMDRNAPQAPTIIPPKASLSDVLIPSENITWSSSGDWRYAPLFGGTDRLIWNNQEFSIYFPLEVKGERKEYTFKFKIKVTKSAAAPKQKK